MNRQQDKQITYPGGSDIIESAGSAGDLGSLGGEDPLEKEAATQYSCLENSMDRA